MAKHLSCDIEAIRPRINIFILHLLFSSLKKSPGIRKIRHCLEQYDRIILVGPIWMGQLIPPLRDFIKRYRTQIKDLIFVTCCGSGYAEKDKKFGHGLVFHEIEKLLGDQCIKYHAFPIGLILTEDQKKDPNIVMNTHLSDANFKGEIKTNFETFILDLKQETK
jgi:flavodoxin